MAEPLFAQIEEIFHQAVALETEERTAFLERACRGNTTLRAAVETLLMHDQLLGTGDGRLASPIPRSPTAPVSDAPTVPAGHAGLARVAVPVPTALPGYEILEELGRGGMGVVYKARQLALDRLVALKMILSLAPTRPDQLARFRIEAESLARLHHPNIVQIYEIGEHEGRPYFAMEYIDGPSLARQHAGVPQPLPAAAHLVEVLARAMAAVHDRGIIHRDLKPENILFQGDVAKITDFGLAKWLEGPGAGTRTGSVMGTPCYMAPEQARGEVGVLGPWTDIYALGAILYELLTGRPPFEAENPAATLAKLQYDPPTSPARWRPGLPRDLETICLKCLEKHPQGRYVTAGALAEDLRRFQAGEPILARPVGLLGELWRWCCRQPATAAAIATAGLLAVVLVITVVGYNVRLKRALAEAEGRAEDRRAQLIKLDITISNDALEKGDAFAALLWLVRLLELDEGRPDEELGHRKRIASLLGRLPRLQKLDRWGERLLTTRCTGEGCWLAGLAAAQTVRTWDVLAGQTGGPDLRHDAPVHLAAFAPDARLLATASADGEVRVWERATGRSRKLPLATSAPVRRLVFHADGRLLLAQNADNVVRCWDAQTGEAVAAPGLPAEPPRFATISGDGRWVFLMDERQTPWLWTPPTTLRSLPWKLDHAIRAATLSPDARLVALIDPGEHVSIRETATGKLRSSPFGHAHSCIGFNSAADRLLTVSAEGSMRVWRVADPAIPLVAIPQESPDELAQLSPDGTLLLARGLDGRLRVWQADTARPLTPPLHLTRAVEQASFSADGKRVLIVDGMQTVRVWELDATQATDLHAEEVAPEHLVRLAEILAGASLDDHGQPTALNAEELLAKWRAGHPSQVP
jgi:WD40 repeat protein/predicted Ser/Thr protein kinase